MWKATRGGPGWGRELGGVSQHGRESSVSQVSGEHRLGAHLGLPVGEGGSTKEQCRLPALLSPESCSDVCPSRPQPNLFSLVPPLCRLCSGCGSCAGAQSERTHESVSAQPLGRNAWDSGSPRPHSLAIPAGFLRSSKQSQLCPRELLFPALQPQAGKPCVVLGPLVPREIPMAKTPL